MSAPAPVAEPVVNLRVRGLRVAGLAAVGTAVIAPILELGTLCPLRRATGVPCPLCGLTRGVEAAVRGDLGAALGAHPLALVAVVVLVAAWTPLGPGIVEGLRRRPGAIAAVLAVVWAARLAGLYGS